MSFLKKLLCKHEKWDIQPSYILLFYDRCQNCKKLRKTVGKIEYTYFNLGEFEITPNAESLKK